MKSSSIELVPENLLASHKRKLYAEDKITPEELELVKKIKDKVLENNISLFLTITQIQKFKKLPKNSTGVFLIPCKWLSLEKNPNQILW